MGATTSNNSCMLVDLRTAKQSSAASGGKSALSSEEDAVERTTAERIHVPSPLQGLASRRKFASTGGGRSRLEISTKKEDENVEPRHPAHHSRRRGIRRGDFQQEFDLGEEVMPSCHKGMQVLNGTNKETGMSVVVKVRFKKESFKSKQEEQDWRETSEFMLNLPSCDHIAQVFDVIEDDKAYYVIMEKVGGQDLFESMMGQELLPVPEVKDILRQILRALSALHENGRIHKDLKLENVMFDRIPTEKPERDSTKETNDEDIYTPTSPVNVKIIDFDTVEAPRLSKDVLGTDQYISPEAYEGRYSTASDVFAIGVIAFQLLTGKLPFNSDMFDDKPGENWVGSPKMKSIRTRLRQYRIKWTYEAFINEPRACDLIRSMLAMNEENRPTAEEALAHPWLAEEVDSPFLMCRSMSMVNPGAGTPTKAKKKKQERSSFFTESSGPAQADSIVRCVSDGHALTSLPHCVPKPS